MPSPPSLRDVSRRAVQGELVAVAERLFDEQGYEATTLEAVAAGAGMSRRTFFRYFSSKEELVLGKYDLLAEQLLERFRARPDDEPLWTTLREMFVGVTPQPGADVPTHAIERVIAQTPALRGGYLYRLDLMQRAIAAEARDRAHRAGAPYDVDDPTPEALVGAAFAALTAARGVSDTSGLPWHATVDRAMGCVRPLGH